MGRPDKFVEQLSDDEADRILAKLLERRPLSELTNARDARTALSHISEYEDEAKERVKNWGRLQGLSSGYWTIDQQTKGLVPGELIVVSGFTSHGKTQLATNIAYKLAKEGHPVLFVTLEMSHAEISSRLMKIAEPEDATTLPIFYQLENNIHFKDVSTLIKKAKADGAEFVVIDHLQMMYRGGQDVVSEASTIVQELKKAAIKHNIPIMLLCHVRKVNEKFAGKRRPPELEDLKDTSAIAQDADVVLLIHRNMEDLEANNDEVRVVLHKNRNRGIDKNSRQAVLKSKGVTLQEGTQGQGNEGNTEVEPEDLPMFPMRGN